MTIDVHTHFHSQALVGKAGALGPSFATGQNGRSHYQIGERRQNAPKAIYDMEERLRAMDAAGIDLHVLSNSPKWFLYNFIHGKVAPETVVAFARAQNDDLMNAVKAHPDRFQAFATLPFVDMKATIAELDRAIDMGVKGLVIDSVINDGGLDSESLFPIYERLEKHGLVLFVHPSFLNDARVERPGFRWIIGFAFDETYAAACLVFGGVLDAFPKLKIMMSHGAGAMPYLLGRFIKGADRPDLETKAKHPFDHYIRRFTYDACLYKPEPLEFLLGLVGEDNLVFGTNYPGSADLGTSVIDSAKLTPGTRQKILHDNARRLFGL